MAETKLENKIVGKSGVWGIPTGSPASTKEIAKAQAIRGEHRPMPLRHHILVSHDIGGDSTTWSQDMFVPFSPDEIVVRSAAYANKAEATIDPGVFVIRTNTLGYEPLALFVDPGVSTPQTVLSVSGKNVNTTWRFSAESVSGTGLGEANAEIGILLEFIKY